jgi:preprotein translocase subunit SecA
MRELERQVLMQVIDRKWREHLYEMDYLKEGIGLRAMAQRDPVIEYQREGFDMFAAMLEGIKEETVGHLFNVAVQIQEVPAPGAEAAPQEAGTAPNGTAPNGTAPSGTAPNGAAAPAAQQAPSAPAAAQPGAVAGAQPAAEPVTNRFPRVPAAAQGPNGAPDDTPTSVLPAALRSGPPTQGLRYSGPSDDGGEVVTRGGGQPQNRGGRQGPRPQPQGGRQAGGQQQGGGQQGGGQQGGNQQGGNQQGNRAERRRQERAARKDR